MTQAIPEITTEIASENNTIPFSEVVQYLNERTDASFKEETKKTKELIQARWREGYTLDDFKRGIDLKVAEWLSDPHFNKYLRSETWFGTKFESYLNQKVLKK